MEFQISCPNPTVLKELGFGVCVFVSGGVASYIIARCLPQTPCDDGDPQSPELVKQLVGLKDEIKYLKSKLANALYDVGRGMDEIRISQQRLSQVFTQATPTQATGTATTRPSMHSEAPTSIRTAPPSMHSAAPSSRKDSRKESRKESRAPTLDSQGQVIQARRLSRESTTDDDDDFLSVKDVLCSDARAYEAESLSQLFIEVDQLNNGNDEDRDKALNLLHDNEVTHPNSSQIKWRLARAHLWRYGEAERPEVKRLHASAALRYAQEALRLNDNSPNSHKWYAVSLATSLDYKSPSEKIDRNKEVTSHIERAIELDPLEAMPYYIKGKWCWGVYKLKWIEKKLTHVMYGAPPHVSLEEVVESFLKAEDLAPGFYKANRLYLAKCYLEKGDYETSKEWLLAAHTLPIQSKEDALNQKIIEEYLVEMRAKVDWF